MLESPIREAVPVAAGEDGVIRVSGTRVPLEIIIATFHDGATAEEIAQQYPSVPLSDIYQLIGYYLRHAPDLEPYLNRQQTERADIKRANESRWSPDGIRQRLLARRQSR